MKDCTHTWWNPLKGQIRKTYITRKHQERQSTVICLTCGMSQVYYMHSIKLLSKKKPCTHCGGRGYI